MTLPVAPNPISISQVAAEIGISAVGLSLNHADVRTLAGVPSGAIGFGNLHGKTWLAVNLTGHSVASTNLGTGPAGITITFQNNGLLSWSRSGQTPTNGSFTGEWLTQLVASTVADDYEIRATLSSGSTPSSGEALNLWWNLGTNRSWTYSITQNGGTRGGTLLIEIRRASDGVVLDSASINMTASSTNA